MLHPFTGCGAAWLARRSGGPKVAGSNPVSPTKREAGRPPNRVACCAGGIGSVRAQRRPLPLNGSGSNTTTPRSLPASAPSSPSSTIGFARRVEQRTIDPPRQLRPGPRSRAARRRSPRRLEAWRPHSRDPPPRLRCRPVAPGLVLRARPACRSSFDARPPRDTPAPRGRTRGSGRAARRSIGSRPLSRVLPHPGPPQSVTRRVGTRGCTSRMTGDRPPRSWGSPRRGRTRSLMPKTPAAWRRMPRHVRRAAQNVVRLPEPRRT